MTQMENLSTRYNKLKGGYGTADATVSLLRKYRVVSSNLSILLDYHSEPLTNASIFIEVASQLGYEDLNSVNPEDMAVQVN